MIAIVFHTSADSVDNIRFEANFITLGKRKHADWVEVAYIYAPLEKGGAYCFAHVGRYVGRSVGISVSLHLVQLITQEHFAPEASNSVGR